MNAKLESLLNKFRTWKETKVNKQPLTRENAYAYSQIGKKRGMAKDVIEHLKKHILDSIMEEARVGNKYLLIKNATYITGRDKKEIIDYLHSLGYIVCFSNQEILLISWSANA